MTRKTIVLVGPDPSAGLAGHAGGQLTAAIGIADYAGRQGLDFQVINTLVDSFSPPTFFRKILAGLGRARSLRKRLSASATDSVILFVGARHSFFERVFLTALARMSGARTLFCIRDGAFIGWMNSSALLRRLVPLLLRIPDRIVVQGTRAQTILAGAGVPVGKLAVVRNWLPSTFEIGDQPRNAEPDSTLRLIFVGWLVNEKGLWELLDACIELSSRYALELDIVGGGTLGEALQKKISDLDLKGIRLLGWLSSAEVRKCLDRAHVFVLPSYFEGFPNALLEAMACGLPALCTDVGAISESVLDGINGFVIPPRNSGALAEAIERYLQNPRLVREHGAASLERVRLLHDRESNLASLFSYLS